jgi:hypothetical protein
MVAGMGRRGDSDEHGEPTLRRAPLSRRALAGLMDAALWGVPTGLALRRMRRGANGPEQGAAAARAREATRIGWSVLGEQFGTPGQWIMGLRTVDRRTGTRLALWRSLAVPTVKVAGGAIAGRLASADHAPPPDPRERELELRAIREAHHGDEEATNAALAEHYRSHRAPPIDLKRKLYIPLALGLLHSQVRRRLAPTTVVVHRGAQAEAAPADGSADQSP